VAAARTVLERDGVAGTTLRAVAGEAGIPLGTLHYAFPSRDLLLTAVTEDIAADVATLLGAVVDLGSGLEHAIRRGLTGYWEQMVVGGSGLLLVQYELLTHALRTPGMENLARWQVDGYTSVVGEWCRQAAEAAGETCAVPYDTLARVLVANVNGLVLQFLSDPDTGRSSADLAAMTEMLVHLASPRPAGQG
jgi:AcrR family transcriptional regulator